LVNRIPVFAFFITSGTHMCHAKVEHRFWLKEID